jgi:hypothetical protein
MTHAHPRDADQIQAQAGCGAFERRADHLCARLEEVR